VIAPHDREPVMHNLDADGNRDGSVRIFRQCRFHRQPLIRIHAPGVRTSCNRYAAAAMAWRYRPDRFMYLVA